MPNVPTPRGDANRPVTMNGFPTERTDSVVLGSKRTSRHCMTAKKTKTAQLPLRTYQAQFWYGEVRLTVDMQVTAIDKEDSHNAL